MLLNRPFQDPAAKSLYYFHGVRYTEIVKSYIEFSDAKTISWSFSLLVKLIKTYSQSAKLSFFKAALYISYGRQNIIKYWDSISEESFANH
jgi:hypothetical protein